VVLHRLGLQVLPGARDQRLDVGPADRRERTVPDARVVVLQRVGNSRATSGQARRARHSPAGNPAGGDRAPRVRVSPVAQGGDLGLEVSASDSKCGRRWRSAGRPRRRAPWAARGSPGSPRRRARQGLPTRAGVLDALRGSRRFLVHRPALAGLAMPLTTLTRLKGSVTRQRFRGQGTSPRPCGRRPYSGTKRRRLMAAPSPVSRLSTTRLSGGAGRTGSARSNTPALLRQHTPTSAPRSERARTHLGPASDRTRGRGAEGRAVRRPGRSPPAR
jgi:hypothetical protein